MAIAGKRMGRPEASERVIVRRIEPHTRQFGARLKRGVWGCVVDGLGRSATVSVRSESRTSQIANY